MNFSNNGRDINYFVYVIQYILFHKFFLTSKTNTIEIYIGAVRPLWVPLVFPSVGWQSQRARTHRARSFLWQINIIILNFLLKNIKPFPVTFFVFPVNSPGKQINCLKRQVFMGKMVIYIERYSWFYPAA